MNAVLLDINVLLDVFLARSAWLADSAAVLKANELGTIRGHVSAAAIPTIFYIVRRNSDIQRARQVVGECLASFDVIAVDRNTLALADSFSGSDFEDNLAIACANLAGLDAIVTRDASGFSASPIPVLTPAELLARIGP